MQGVFYKLYLQMGIGINKRTYTLFLNHIFLCANMYR